MTKSKKMFKTFSKKKRATWLVLTESYDASNFFAQPQKSAYFYVQVLLKIIIK